jgi:hypothetical protein
MAKENEISMSISASVSNESGINGDISINGNI